jgi:hypothetical protein
MAKKGLCPDPLSNIAATRYNYKNKDNWYLMPLSTILWVYRREKNIQK